MHPYPNLIASPETPPSLIPRPETLPQVDDKSSVDLAVERGDTGALVELLAAGPPSDPLHDGLQSALEIAARGGHARVGSMALVSFDNGMICCLWSLQDVALGFMFRSL